MSETPTPIAEIDHGPSKFEQFLEAHQKKLVILAILIFLGVLAFVFFKEFNKLQNQKAGAMLLEASSEEEYQKVITEYPSLASAGTAFYSIAAQRTTDADAIEAFSQFISNYPEHPLVPQAELRLALRQINTGKLDEAKATLDQLSARENAQSVIPKAKILLGDIAIKQNDQELATNYYNEAAELNQGKHPFAAEAKAKLEYMNAKKPEIVDAPKPSPAAIDPIKPSDAGVEPAQKLELPGTSTPETPTQDAETE